MATQRQKTVVRREQIAQAALDVLAEHGPTEISMARIAKRLGLATSASYRHFPGKDEIIDGVIDLVDARLTANVAAVCRESSSPSERLESLLRRQVQLIRNNSGIPKLIFSGEVFSGSPNKRGRLHRLIDGYLSRVASIIAEGQRTGVFRTDVKASTLAVHFLGIIHPAVILGHLSDGSFDVRRHAAAGWKLFLDAVSVHGSEESPTSKAPPSRRKKEK